MLTLRYIGQAVKLGPFIKPSRCMPLRLYSQLSKPESKLPIKKQQKVVDNIITNQLKQHIPGETGQTNELIDRIPKFPLAKDAVPTLLPRPGVPKVGSNLSIMAKTLKAKQEPELIYESESHRLYFMFCGAFALVILIYGVLFLDWAMSEAWRIYKTNEQDLPPAHNLTMFILRAGVTLAIFAIPAALAGFLLMVPTRLIRQMWYIGKGKELIRFTTHPLIPGRPTPVHTVPLENLNRSYKAKIFTNNGFYLTLDKGSFLFMLKETGTRFPWIVDRKGFFWGDGRLFDHLFGKESIEEADLGISYDDKFGAINEKLKQDIGKLKAEDGFGWQFKEQAKMLKQDVKHLAKKFEPRKKLGKGKTKTKKAKKSVQKR